MSVRVISAALGSLLTALTLTPLDVAKTRLQLASNSVTSDVAAGSLTKRLPLQSTLSTILYVARNEGVLALWSGFAASMVLALPSAVLYYAAYDEMREILRADSAPGSIRHTFAPVLAGMGGRTVTVFVVSPLELLRTRAMSPQAQGSESAFTALRHDVARFGPSTLWRGLMPTLWRDVPFSGIYWLAYERIKASSTQRLLDAKRAGATRQSARSVFEIDSALSPESSVRSNPPQLTFWESYAVSFAAGTSAGALAAVVTTPFDVVKTLAQTAGPQAVPDAASALPHFCESSVSAACGCAPEMRAAALQTCVHNTVDSKSGQRGGAPLQPGTVALLLRILRAQGVSGLFAGLPARVAKVAPACAIMISSYEAGKRVFASEGAAQ